MVVMTGPSDGFGDPGLETITEEILVSASGVASGKCQDSTVLLPHNLWKQKKNVHSVSRKNVSFYNRKSTGRNKTYLCQNKRT